MYVCMYVCMYASLEKSGHTAAEMQAVDLYCLRYEKRPPVELDWME
jgi:hypothetical protein